MLRIHRFKRHPNRPESERDCFKMVFLTVAIGATLCAISASAIAVCLSVMTANEQKLFDALLSSFTLSVGAILGLLGGRAATRS